MVKFSIYLNRRVFVMWDAQADLSLRCVHMSEGSFSHTAAHMVKTIISKSKTAKPPKVESQFFC